MIAIKRAYEPAERGDGTRILVERLWPRGLKKTELRLDGWAKEIAPSPELRRWYQHDVAKWPEFQKRYRAELKTNGEAIKPLVDAAKRGKLTLVYGARDEEHNSALVLEHYLESQL